MDEIFKVEQTGKGSKRRWNVWKYHVIGKAPVGEPNHTVLRTARAHHARRSTSDSVPFRHAGFAHKARPIDDLRY
jgi:hypothetical protein